ncbi:MarR family transcriptional regulator [Desulfoscipio sp. XC116]|uniref:MarR family winged helix-turn-helix transcriptional regulator n=1 Tax=Desulfoscipio sp. XC116 TaxID=3144975 RepID=UPI00325AA7D6
MSREVLSRYIDRLDEMGRHFLRRMHQELAQTMDKGVTGNQFIVLKMIYDQGRRTVSEVADELCVSLSAVTAQVDRLCRMGMVERRRSEKDRRVVWLQLTNEGRAVVKDCQAGRQRVIQRYLGRLEEEELLHMIEIYEKILHFMKLEEKGGGCQIRIMNKNHE